MSNTKPPGEYILAQLSLSASTLKSLDKRHKRSHYRACINWIESYQPKSDESRVQQVFHLIEAFYHLCDAEDLERASSLFFIQATPHINEELHKQLYIWGLYDEFLGITSRLIELLNRNSEMDENAYILKSICLKNLGIIEFIRGNYVVSTDYYKQQLELSRKIEDLEGESSALIGLGQNLIVSGEYLKANETYLFLQDIADKISDKRLFKKLVMAAKSGLGNIQIYLGQYELAIPYFQAQLTIARQLSDESEKIQALANLGNAYSLTGDHLAAVESQLSALKITHLIQNPQDEAKILAHLGFSFYIQNEYRAAISFYKQSLTISRSIGLFLQEAEALEKVGVLEGKLAKSRDEAQLSLSLLSQALAQFRKAASPSNEARVLKEIAEAYDDLGEIEQAIEACQKALKLADEQKLPLYDQCAKLKEHLYAKKDTDKLSATNQLITRKFRVIDLNQNSWIKADIVLLTATDIELNAVLSKLKIYPGKKDKLKIFEGPETYYVGKFGAFIAAVTKCRMGSVGEGSVILATDQAQRTWEPKAIIMVGIAFGRDSTKQKIGDVLVASQIISYEPQRIGDPVQHRGSIPPSNTTLLNRFENVHDWEFPSLDGSPCNLQVGPILSGEKLINDEEFKSALFQQFPQAVGGEMEGAGLCAASGRVGVAWI